MKRILPPILISLALVLNCWGQPVSGPLLPSDPAELLGYTPAMAIERFGAPSRVYAVRGGEAWQDDVVFDYGGFGLFLFSDRVWQVRIGADYPRPVLGFNVGAGPDRIQATLGLPASTGPDSWEWELPGRSWPVRLRAQADETGKVMDIYLYRADF